MGPKEQAFGESPNCKKPLCDFHLQGVPMISEKRVQQSTSSSTLADILERILDKGVVIAGDIKVKLVDIELLTIQIRLMISSVDKAKEMGMDWWNRNPDFCSRLQGAENSQELLTLRQRVNELETRLANQPEMKCV
jgi:hypothetical protein